ncbi:MAG: nuclear transport factor 2 family protein [Porticoccaceae bacterium]|jgi:hypothetical protein|nr:nuclear transport factor 2 family protein [Porticoccaceae bacterium]HLS97262.1 nuclear transport factor 2 family protein [Porticoccaceae bacterium]
MDLLTRLMIQQHCQDLVNRYALAVNDNSLEDFVALFTADAKWQRPNVAPMNGLAEIRAFIAGEFAKSRTIRHVNGAHLVEVIDADNARGWSQTTVYQQPGQGLLPVIGTVPEMVVEYRDRYRRENGLWRIARRDTNVVFTRE